MPKYQGPRLYHCRNSLPQHGFTVAAQKPYPTAVQYQVLRLGTTRTAHELLGLLLRSEVTRHHNDEVEAEGRLDGAVDGADDGARVKADLQCVSELPGRPARATADLKPYLPNPWYRKKQAVLAINSSRKKRDREREASPRKNHERNPAAWKENVAQILKSKRKLSYRFMLKL